MNSQRLKKSRFDEDLNQISWVSKNVQYLHVATYHHPLTPSTALQIHVPRLMASWAARAPVGGIPGAIHQRCILCRLVIFSSKSTLKEKFRTDKRCEESSCRDRRKLCLKLMVILWMILWSCRIQNLIWPRKCPKKASWIRGKLDVLLCCSLFGLTDWHGNDGSQYHARSSVEPDDDEAVLSSFFSGLNGSFAKTPIKSSLKMLNEINTGFITKKSLDFLSYESFSHLTIVTDSQKQIHPSWNSIYFLGRKWCQYHS